MTITLTPKEAEEHFFNALCNGLGYITSSYGLRLEYDSSEYDKAKSVLKKSVLEGHSICIEDVFMQMLRMGYTLTMDDLESDESYTITMKDVHDRVQNTPHWHLLNMIDGNDDGDTADAILQTTFFKEIIFG